MIITNRRNRAGFTKALLINSVKEILQLSLFLKQIITQYLMCEHIYLSLFPLHILRISLPRKLFLFLATEQGTHVKHFKVFPKIIKRKLLNNCIFISLCDQICVQVFCEESEGIASLSFTVN